MAVLKVYDGAAWVPAVGKVYDGAAWKAKKKFYDGTAWIELYSTGTVPSVSNIYIKHTVTSGPVNARFIANYLGTNANKLHKGHNLVYTEMGNDDAASPVDHTGEWTSDSVTGADWEIACTSLITGSWDVEPVAVGTYVDLSVAREWREHRIGGKSYTPGTDNCKANFRIREKADPTNFTDFTVDCYAVQS